MATNNQQTININLMINKIITDLLFNPNLDKTYTELGELFKIILSSPNSIYEDKDLYILLHLIDELKLSSPVLNIYINTIKYNSLSAKILTPINNNNQSCCDNQENNKEDVEIYQVIEKNPELKIKTIRTIKKNKCTGEESVIEEKTIKEPDATNLDGIFAGILQKEIKDNIENI